MTNPPIIVTAPATEPITLTEAKLWLKVDDTADDTLITDLITAAREHIEGQTSRRLITQTLKVFYPSWRSDFALPVGPVASITHLKYYDTENTAATVDVADYALDGDSNPPYIRRAYNITWPDTTLRTLNPIEIQFVAGYGNAAAVPIRLKTAMLALIATWYRHRETVTVGTSASVASPIPQHFQAFIDSLKLYP